MRKVELVKGVSSSALAFGCASVLGSVSAKDSARAIACALDYGITHFDIARSYGYGEAEQFVGNALKGRRDKVVLATKFGIAANWKAILLKPAKPAVRFLVNQIKKKPGEQIQKTVNTGAPIADRFHDRLPINARVMRSSLEKSLKALKTDYLDYFFVHETLQHIAQIDELAAVANVLKAEGKIRAWGITFMRSQQQLHNTYLDRFDVLQFDNSPFSDGYEATVADRGEKANAIFSPLRGGNTEMKAGEKLNQLFADFPQSIVICSMFNERHIIANASLVGCCD